MIDLSVFRRAIRKLHGCDSVHAESVLVHEELGGEIVWERTVEVFTLRNHPKAKRCYIWSHTHDVAGERFIAVLELPPIDSAQRAVQVAIANEGNRNPLDDSFAGVIPGE
jgi:hypothetical protein